MPQGRRRSDTHTHHKGKSPKLTAKQAAKQRASTPVDKIVGTCVRERRIVLGWSQEELAEKLKISFQQVQKYESGTNRIGASRLYQIARVLDTDINYFYGTLPMSGKAIASKRVAPELREVATPIAPTPKGKAQKNKGQQRAALALVRHYYKIQSPSMRRGLVQTVHAFSEQKGGTSAKGKKGVKKAAKKTPKKATKKATKKTTKKAAKKTTKKTVKKTAKKTAKKSAKKASPKKR